MDWGEMIKSAWFWVITTIGGGSLIGLIVVVCIMVAKGKIAKFISQINVKQIYKEVHEEAFKDVQNGIKEVVFKQNIQPVLESGLEKVNEKTDERLVKYIGNLEKKMDLLHEENKAFASYFDSSIGVTDEAKARMKKAIENYEKDMAEIEPANEQTIEVKEIIIEQPKTENNPQKTEKKSKVER